MIKITTLVENSGGNMVLQEEHGLSMFIETKNQNILFDTGQSQKFINNAKKLGIDLATTDHVIISHSHYDHGGGYSYLIDGLDKQPVLHISQYFFLQKYTLNEEGYEKKGVPINEAYLMDHGIIAEYVRDKITYIARDVFLAGNFQNPLDFEKSNGSFYIKKNGQFIQDNFRDEIALCIKCFEGLVVIVGC